MRLTLDWDSEEIKETHFPAVQAREPAEATESQSRIGGFLASNDPEALSEQSDQVELWQSSGGEGYHYIEYGLSHGLTRNQQLRRVFGGDETRINMDAERISNGSQFVNVLYHMKGIQPGEQKPYQTGERAQLLSRSGFDASGTVDTKDEETGQVDYQTLLSALADHPDFNSRADVIRRVQRRDSVNVTTRPSARGYDIAEGRRSPTAAEAKALRDYAQSREIGHYSDAVDTTEGIPAELAEKPTRTTVHEYFEIPQFEFDTEEFDPENTESEWYSSNLRTGTYSDEVDEMTVKQVHDRIANRITSDILVPEPSGHDMGLDEISRFDRAISLERDRHMDIDEKARYRRVFVENQPAGGTDPETVMQDMDPFSDSADVVTWEYIVYNDNNNVWWLARGVLDVSEGVRNPIDRSRIVADTNGWL